MERSYSDVTALDTDKTKAAMEEARLVGELIEARLKMFALKAELNRATFSRVYESHVKLVQAEKAATDKWNGLFLELRTHRSAVHRQLFPPRHI